MTEVMEDYAHIANEATRAQINMPVADWLGQDDLHEISRSLLNEAIEANERDDQEGTLDKTIVDQRAACVGSAYMHSLVGYYPGIFVNLKLYYSI